MPPRKSRRKRLMLAFLTIFLLPVLIGAGALAYRGGPTHWSDWDRNVTSQLPSAAEHPQARILVMSGRTRGWKGVVAVHSWIVVKGENEPNWRRYDVAGWGSPLRLNWWPPDLWFGERGKAIVDITDARAQALIPRVDAAIRSYQYSNYGDYRIWPGPNSNTFVASVLRAIPETEVALPPNAIGRDFRPVALSRPAPTAAPASRPTSGACSASRSAGSKASRSTCSAWSLASTLRNPGVKVPAFGHIGWPHAYGDGGRALAVLLTTICTPPT